MKRQIEKRSDGILRFFTPELYLRFGSDDDTVADAADDAWEAAIKAYDERLGAIRKQLPPSAVALAELCLHDRELLSFDEQNPGLVKSIARHAAVQMPDKLRTAGLSLQNGQEVIDLIYILVDGVRKRRSRQKKLFGDGDKLWLYDEVDIHNELPGASVHRILFSDGSEIEIPFHTVIIRKIFCASRRTHDESTLNTQLEIARTIDISTRRKTLLRDPSRYAGGWMPKSRMVKRLEKG